MPWDHFIEDHIGMEGSWIDMIGDIAFEVRSYSQKIQLQSGIFKPISKINLCLQIIVVGSSNIKS